MIFTQEIEDWIKARVAKGAALLDERKPGWAHKISPVLLQMYECSHCVIGQVYDLGNDYVYGAYSETVEELFGFGNSNCDSDYGFSIKRFYAGLRLDEMDEFAALRDCWLAEVARRMESVS